MSRKPKHLLWLFLIVAGLVTVAVGAASSRGIFALKAPANSAVSPSVNRMLVANAPLQKERLGYALVTLTPAAFEPAEITQRGRRFFLMIENRSGFSNLTLRIDPEHGNRIREVNQPTDQRKWIDEMDLPPSKYHISTPNRPGWVCQLTVKP